MVHKSFPLKLLLFVPSVQTGTAGLRGHLSLLVDVLQAFKFMKVQGTSCEAASGSKKAILCTEHHREGISKQCKNAEAFKTWMSFQSILEMNGRHASAHLFGSAWSFMHTMAINWHMAAERIHARATNEMNEQTTCFRDIVTLALSGNITRKSCTMYNTFNHQTPLPFIKTADWRALDTLLVTCTLPFNDWNPQVWLVLAFGRFSLLDFRSWNDNFR